MEKIVNCYPQSDVSDGIEQALQMMQQRLPMIFLFLLFFFLIKNTV